MHLVQRFWNKTFYGKHNVTLATLKPAASKAFSALFLSSLLSLVTILIILKYKYIDSNLDYI